MSIRAAQLQTYYLAGSGAVIGDTSITLKSFQTIDGTNLAITDFGTGGYATIDPGNGTLEEQISFTGVTQNSNGTATLTGVKTVLFITPYTETSGLAKTHAGSAPFVISNTSGFYNTFGNKQNNETLTGLWEAPDPVATQGIATKAYVLSVITGTSTISSDKIINLAYAGAGEAIVAGSVVYLNSDGKWYLAKANDTSKIFNVQLGIAQGANSGGLTPIITNGVLIEGYDGNQSGLTTGTTYYIDNNGAVSATPGDTARIIGQGGQSATKLYFNPNYNFLSPNDILFSVLAGENLTAGNSVYIKTSDGKAYKTDATDLTKMNFAGIVVATTSSGGTAQIRLSGKVSTTGLTTGSRYYVSGTGGAITATAPTTWVNVGVALSPNVLNVDKFVTKRTVQYIDPGTQTWTKRPGLKFVEVEVQAGGGGSGGCTNTYQANGAGGGGGYSRKIIPVNNLTDIVTVTIGAGGTAGAGASGGNGGQGGTSSFGSYLSATGGGGGQGGQTVGNPGAGGTGTGGDINIQGSDGVSGFTTGATAIVGGKGGDSHMGGGGYGAYAGVATSANAGHNYGGGAGGGGNGSGSGDIDGAAGGSGCVLVHEYY